MSGARLVLASRLERLALALERFPWGALYRAAIGFSLVPLYSMLAEPSASSQGLFGFFLVVLLSLRVGPAILRKALPFSESARAVWFERRMMAKRYDSFQWQKLQWFGLGLLAYTLAFDREAMTGWALTFFCLAGGLLGRVALKRRLAQSVTSSA
jgi:hypothetical protein